jgi:hypothetical protein
LAEEMTFSLHLMRDFIYRVLCGAPSGSPITSILNSMVNSLYIRVAWQLIFRRGEATPPTFEKSLRMNDFRKNVSLRTNGDDLIMSVVENVAYVFNAVTIGKIFGKFNIVFTDAAKKGLLVPFLSIDDEDTTYLKSTFIKHPKRNLFIRKLDRRAVQETSNWIMKTRDPVSMSMEACTAMMLNAHAFGKDEYNTLRNKILQFWGRKRRSFLCPTWSELDEMYYGDGAFPSQWSKNTFFDEQF